MQLQKYEAMTKINLTEDERVWIGEQASLLLKKFDYLSKIETDGVLPLTTVLDLSNTMREDVVVKNFTRDEILANAPSEYDGYFQVPKAVHI